MWGKFKDHLVADANYWYKRWSSWLALVWGTITGIFWYNPEWMSTVVAAIPSDLRSATSPIIWIAMTALPILIVNIRQKNLTPPCPPPADGTDQ